MEIVTILGVQIDPLPSEQVLERLRSFLNGKDLQHIVTPNNEMLLMARQHPEFRAVLNAAALRIPDSTGLLLAARMTRQTLPERVTGVDTVDAFCSTLTADHPVFFLGGRGGAGQKAAEALQRRNPQMTIAGVYEGTPSDADADAIIERITASGAQVLLVAFGAPAQDMWIDKHRDELSSVRIAMGIGGTFDFLSGTVRRAPAWVRSAGLEWLWRLIRQPKRIGRIWNAVVVFPLTVLWRGREA